MTGFARASRLYDVETGERVQWDWGKMQPVADHRPKLRVLWQASRPGLHPAEGDEDDRAGPTRVDGQLAI